MEEKNSAKLPEKTETTPHGQRPADCEKEKTSNVIPDEVPRKDGPGGE